MKIDIKQCGAAGDGKADDTAALQKALTGGRRTVIIPAGTYLVSKTLKVDSGTIIQADHEAIIRMADHSATSADSFLLTNRDHETGNVNITIDGGVWDGNNAHNPRGAADRQPCYTGVVLNFIHVRRLTLRNLIVRNPESYSIRACELYDFLIENIGFDGSSIRPNQDGVHLNGFCEDGVIRNLRALSPWATNDDMVALNADDGFRDVMNQGMKVGPIRRITVEKLRGDSVYTFVRMLSYQQPLEDITVSDVVGGCRVNALNMDSWEFPKDGGMIRNITLRDFTVHRAADAEKDNAHNIPILTVQVAVHNLRIENFRREPADGLPAPTMMLGNKKPMRIQLEGLTDDQKAGLLKHSTQLTPEMFTAAGKTHNLLQADKTALVTLPTGGFSLLTMDSVN